MVLQSAVTYWQQKKYGEEGFKYFKNAFIMETQSYVQASKCVILIIDEQINKNLVYDLLF